MSRSIRDYLKNKRVPRANLFGPADTMAFGFYMDPDRLRRGGGSSLSTGNRSQYIPGVNPADKDPMIAFRTFQDWLIRTKMYDVLNYCIMDRDQQLLQLYRSPEGDAVLEPMCKEERRYINVLIVAPQRMTTRLCRMIQQHFHSLNVLVWWRPGKIPPTAIQHIGKIPTLLSFCLQQKALTQPLFDLCAEHLTQIKELRCSTTIPYLRHKGHYSGFNNLQILALSGPQQGSKMECEIGDMPGLQSLELMNMTIETPQAEAQILPHSSLKNLILYNSHFGTRLLGRVAEELTELEVLDVGGSLVKQDELMELEKMPWLRVLRLDNLDIFFKEVQEIVGLLPNLEVVSVYRNGHISAEDCLTRQDGVKLFAANGEKVFCTDTETGMRDLVERLFHRQMMFLRY